MLSAPAAGSLPEVERARTEFAEIGGQRQQAVDDPRRTLALLRDATPDENLRAGLDRLAARLASDERARADLAATALAAQLEAAIVLARNVWSFSNIARVQRLGLDGVQDPANRRTIEEGAARNLGFSEGVMDSYARLLRQIATGPARAAIAPQMAIIETELTARTQTTLLPFLPIVRDQALALAAGRPVPRDTALAAIRAPTQQQVNGQ